MEDDDVIVRWKFLTFVQTFSAVAIVIEPI